MTLILKKACRHLSSIFISLFLPSISNKEFQTHYEHALQIYKNKKDSFSFKKFLMPGWMENTITIESFFLESFSMSFLRHPLIKSTMFAHLPKKATVIQKKLIDSYFGKNMAAAYLRESLVGSPILNDLEYKTSGNSIHHLFHLAKFGTVSNVNVKNITTYLELGGGYGNLAKLVKRINPNATYTIIDIPIFSFIQYVYLCTVLGRDQVVIFDPATGIKPEKVNLLPLDENLIKNFIALNFQPEIFVSTWALSESNPATQLLVSDNDYFGAQYLLLAYQKANESFAFAEEVSSVGENYKVIHNEITEYMPDNFYLFAART